MKSLSKSEKVLELVKRRGFFFPSYEIYGGVSGLFDYGPLGFLLKRKIEEKWRETFVKRYGFMEIETPIASPGKVFVASGHAEHFTDKMVECRDCARKWRVDHLIEEQVGIKVEGLNKEQIEGIIEEKEVKCPECKGELGKVKLFNLMFRTSIGPYVDRIDFLRPETAQAMFTNFKRLYEYARKKLPIGVAQIGHCFRNEISPRQGPIRLREFTIMEFEFFYDPIEASCPYLKEVELEVLPLLPALEKEKGAKSSINVTVKEALEKGYIMTEWQAYFMAISKNFLLDFGIPIESQRFDEKMPWERAHYAAQTYDHEVLCDRWGWIEIAGISYRTDFDLKMHMEKAGIDMHIKRKDGTKFIPHVVEPSYGCDRLLYVLLEYAYSEKQNRIILKIPIDLAPIQIAILPLVSRNGLPEKAYEVYRFLKEERFEVEYDESGYIGRRYARMDEIGVPLCITIDYQTLQNNTVTIRSRNTWKQIRERIEVLPELLKKVFSKKISLDIG